MPSITVLMAVYNGMPYLPEACESVLQQTTGDWELLFVNDGSTDGSRDYLASLQDDRIRIVDQENQGLAAALNHGLSVCNTEFIARLDSDDVCLPNRLELQLEYMKSHPDVGMLGTQIDRLGASRAGFRSTLPCEHDAIVEALLRGEHAMCHPTIMCRTEVMKKVGGYWEHPIAQDWDIYLKISEHARIANLPQSLVKYRIHTGSLNGQRLADIRRNQRFAAECARRRRQSLPEIEFAEHLQAEADRPLSWRIGERINVFAMRQYRLALANILGDHEWLGYMQLAFAAGCSPRLTSKRITRMLRNRSGSQPIPESASSRTGGA